MTPDQLTLLRLSLGVIAQDLGRARIETHSTHPPGLGGSLDAPAADDPVAPLIQI